MPKAIKFKNDIYLDTKGIVHNRQILADILYPVGSVYISVTNIDPSNLFGGTWEQIKDRFLLSCGDNYNVGDVGGEETHILTSTEIPHIGSGVGWGGNSIAGGSGWRDVWLGGAEIPEAHNNMPPYLAVYMWKRIA